MKRSELLYLIEMKVIIIVIIVTPSNYLRILIAAIIRATGSRLSALNIPSLRAGRNEYINYSIVGYYTKKRLNSDSKIY